MSPEAKRRVAEGRERVRQEKLARVELVDNEPFREWLLSHEGQATRVCQYMNVYGYTSYMRWAKARGRHKARWVPATTHLKRQLGIKARTGEALKLHLPYEEAVTMTRAMYLDPTDTGV